jgi:hypothetical protein
VRTAAASTANGSQLGPILADAVYPIGVFCRLAGINKWALREAKRRGLKVKKIGVRAFVSGRDFLEFVNKID